MNGVYVVRAVLVGDNAVKALVPATRIQGGVMKQGTSLPAISIQSVSGSDLNIPNPAAVRQVTERVQVTVLAADYDAQKSILAAVKNALADKRPTYSGLSEITMHTAGQGPDFVNEDASIYLGSMDFRVIYNEAAS